jgi:hypothetical protein
MTIETHAPGPSALSSASSSSARQPEPQRSDRPRFARDAARSYPGRDHGKLSLSVEFIGRHGFEPAG